MKITTLINQKGGVARQLAQLTINIGAGLNKLNSGPLFS
jgi:hypothetical protein